MPFLRGLLKFIKITLIVLAIPAGIVASPYLFFIGYTYWYPTSLHGLGPEDEAMRRAVPFPHDSKEPYPPCDWANPDMNQRRCIWLNEQTRQYCRWWTMEWCRPYMVSDQVLINKKWLKTTIQAVVDPCFYLLKPYKPDSNRCQYTKDREPVILIFKGKVREIRIRFDFFVPSHKSEQKG